MTDLSITNALARAAEKLTDEEHAQRRMGIAAATQMFVTFIGFVDCATDQNYDEQQMKTLETIRSFIHAFQYHSADAQAGFLFSLADHLFSSHESGPLHGNAHERDVFHANPPLTRSQMCDLEDSQSQHNGVALTPRERRTLASRWLRGALRKAARQVSGMESRPA